MAHFTPQHIDKPWGHELIWAMTDRYVGKILHIEAGESLSLQYHELKDETIYLLSGKMVLKVGDFANALEEVTMEPGQSFHINTRLVHPMVAVTTCDVAEVSTPEIDDVVRLEDRYGRA